MKPLWKKIGISFLLFLCIYGVILFLQSCVHVKEKRNEEPVEFWYTDDRLSAYVTGAAAAYEEKYGGQVNCILVSSEDYLQQIASISVTDTEQTPDLYILQDGLLENAYAAGLAAENSSDVYTENSFAKTALDAVTYHEQKIAYPLSFLTACMVYRDDLISEPSTLDIFLNQGLAVQGIPHLLQFNTSDYLCDYAFIGKYVNVGGASGDERNKIEIDTQTMTGALDFYQSLVTQLGITANQSEDAMIQSFLEGKTMCLLLNTQKVAELYNRAKEVGISFKVAKVPDLSEEQTCISGARTDCLVVNGLSKNQVAAEKFAEFITTEYAEHLYEDCNLIPAYREVCAQDEVLEQIHEIYGESKPLPKMLETEDFRVCVEVMFNEVTGGLDATSAALEFSGKMESRLVTDK